MCTAGLSLNVWNLKIGIFKDSGFFFQWEFVIFLEGWNWKIGVRRPLWWQRGLCCGRSAIFEEHHRSFKCCKPTMLPWTSTALYVWANTNFWTLKTLCQCTQPLCTLYYLFSRIANLTPAFSLWTVSTSVNGDMLTWLQLCGITWWDWQGGFTGERFCQISLEFSHGLSKYAFCSHL